MKHRKPKTPKAPQNPAADIQARQVAKLQVIAFAIAGVALWAIIEKSGPKGQAATPIAQVAPPAPEPEEEGYLLDGSWFEDTLIGLPLDAAWAERRTLAKTALLGL